MIKIILTVILTISLTAQATNQCMDLFKESKKTVVLTAAELNDLTVEIDSFIKSYELPQILTGRQKPKWIQYDALMNIIEKTDHLNSDQINSISLNMKFASQMVNNSSKEKIKQIISDDDGNKSFDRFLDYNTAYFKLLEQFNRNLKSEIIAIPSFKNIPSETQLIEEGQKIVKNIQNMVDVRFKIEGEFDKKDRLKTKIINFDSKLVDLVDVVENDLIVTVRRPESGRFWIPITGLQNQRITESSKGSYFADSTNDHSSGRDQAEANLTKINVKDYVPLSARLKPNYGEARPSFARDDVKFNSNAAGYGDDLWVIKKSVLENRATWTPSDSLYQGRAREMAMFIPWKEKLLMVLYSMTSFKDREFGTRSIPSDFTLRNPFNWASDQNYFEVQIFGPLGLNDAEAFHFTKNPPDKKFYELLKSKGIKVFDTRNNQNKEYFGEESQ